LLVLKPLYDSPEGIADQSESLLAWIGCYNRILSMSIGYQIKPLRK